VVAVTTFAEQKQSLWLAAWSAEAGRLKWRWLLPAGANATNIERALVGTSIVVRSAEAIVRLDLETGQVVWTGPATAPLGRLCANKAYVGVSGGKAPTRVLNWQTGRPFDVKPGACETPYSSEDAGPNFQYLAASTLTDLRKRPKDFAVVRGLLPKQGNARVILGTVGTEAVPTVSVVANGRWIWQRDISARTGAELPDPALAAVRRESVVVPFWDLERRVLRLSAFNLTSGARLWEAALSEPMTMRTDLELDVGVTLDGVVMVLFDGRLQAFSLSTGGLQWSLGRP
jgi:outer membrane protein assembly factor BamB